MPVTRIDISIPGETDYSVRVGDGVLDELGSDMRATPAVAKCPTALVLSDSNVAPLYLPRTIASLRAANYNVFDITVEAGESSKCVDVANEMWQAMAQLGLGRDCCVVALGGGVIGDLGGFVGSTFMRGMPIVQVPTTLLSMVDSSVGGKTGINLPSGKNLVGAFTQPSYVCASTDTLSTLPDREWLCGLGEVAKSSAIDSDDFFFWLMENAASLSARDPVIVNEAITRCIVFKADVVSEDKTESKGVRECLNYGHTLAHAVESLAGYGTFSHGACVQEGMRFAAVLGMQLGITSEQFARAQTELLDSLGLSRLDWKAPVDKVIACMKRDKKVRDGQLRFVILADVADWGIVDVDDEDVKRALEAFWDM